jgi:hypothetical protein
MGQWSTGKEDRAASPSRRAIQKREAPLAKSAAPVALQQSRILRMTSEFLKRFWRLQCESSGSRETYRFKINL